MAKRLNKKLVSNNILCNISDLVRLLPKPFPSDNPLSARIMHYVIYYIIYKTSIQNKRRLPIRVSI